MRFLVPGDLRPGANLVPLSNVPELQYLNQYGLGDPLANNAADREGPGTLLYNFYKIIADHFHSEILAGFETGTLDDTEQAQISAGVMNRILYGHSILGFMNGRLTSVSPRFWWPLMEKTVQIGDVFIIPYNTSSFSGSLQGAGQLPDMALVINQLFAAPPEVWEVAYNGITLGTNWTQSTVRATRFSTWGDGLSDFPQMGNAVQAIDKLIRGANMLLDRHAQPHLQVPSSAVRYDQNGNPFLTVDPEGMIFPVNADDKDVKYVSPAAAPEMWQLALNKQLQLLAAVTNAPLSIFGEFPLPRLESAASIEAVTVSSTKKVRALRGELEGAIRELALTVSRVATQATQNGLGNQ